MKKRLFSLLMALAMMLSLLPAVAFAADAHDDAVAYVTTGEGDAKTPIQKSDYDNAETTDMVENAGYFKTLEAAVAACPVNKNASDKADNAAAAEAGAVTIKMLSNVLIKSNSCLTVAKGQNITVDLAGFDIAQECQTNAASYVFDVSGILTIKDSTDTDADGEDCGTIYNTAGWTIDKDHPWGSSGYGFCNDLIRQQSGSTVTIESGELKNNGNYCPYCIDVHSGNTVTNVKGGWLHSPTSSSIRVIAYNSKNNNPQVLNISGGHLGSPTDVATLWCQTTGNTAKLYTTVNISGGLIQVRGNGSNYAISDDGGAQGMCYNISGGTIDCGTDGYAFYTHGGDVNITGGTLGGLFAIKCTTEEENVKISGGTFKGKLSVFGEYAKKGFITGGNFVSQTNYDDAETLYVKADGSIWFKTRYFSEQDLTGERYQCLQDYVDDGYVIHAKFGLNVKNKNDKEAGYSRLEQFDICTKDNKRTVDTVYIYETEQGWTTTAEERQRPFLKVEEIYEQNPAEYRFRDYNGYTCEYINWAISNYGAGLTITQEDYDNTTFASGYDYSYTNCKDLAILNDRVYRGYTSWGSGSNYLGTEQNPGPWAYKQIAGNLEAWEANGYILEKHGQEGAYTQYYAYKSLGGSSLIAEGYVDKTNADNPNTYDVVPVEVNLGKAEIEEETIKVKGEEITVTYKGEENAGTGEEEDDKPTIVEAADAITETLQNTSVSGFLDTKIDDSTKTNDEAIKSRMIEQIAAEDSEIKEALKDAINDATINSETETKYDKRVDVDLKVADVIKTTSVETSTSATTTLKVAVFDVQPNAKVTVKLTNTDTGEVITERTYETPIKNEEITDAIAFRVPVNYKESAHAVKVWHKAKDQGMPTAGDESTYGVPQGLKFVQTAANGDKFVQLESDHFSYWTYEIVKVEENAVVVILDEENNYRNFESLADAIADWKSEGNEDDVTMILMQDITAPEDDETTTEIDESKFNFDSKEIALDLNGHYLTGTSTNATGVTVSNADSSKQATLAATGVYANDVSGFIIDGYDTRDNHEEATPAVGEDVVENEVFNNTKPETFEIEVIAETTTDHDDTNDGATLHQENRVDVYADEYVTVKVVVNGARFTAADVTLSWDTSLFEDDTATWELPTGWNALEMAGNDKIYGWRFTSPKDSDTYYEDGTVLGEFTFKALYINESKINDLDNLCTFTVNHENTFHPAKVIGSWGITLKDDTTTPVPAENLYDDFAKILLMNSMTGAVEGKTNLIYKGSELDQKLLNDKYNNNKGWSAKVGGQEYGAATIEYAVLTPDDAAKIGTQKKDDSDQPLYIQEDGSVDIAETDTPANYTAEDFLNYSSTLPTGQDAGTYVVYYRIMADGYQTVENSVQVTIAKQKVNLEWTAPIDFTGSGASFTGEYSADGFVAPTAKFSNLDGTDTYLTTDEIVWTTGPNADKSLKDVGEYTFTAQDLKNYEFNNPVCTVKVTGKEITGWTLEATGNGTILDKDGNVDVTQGVIWRDGKSYPIGELVIGEGASIVWDETDGRHEDADGNEVTNVKVVYEYSEDNGHTWNEVPDPSTLTYDDLGTRQLRMTVTADNYEKIEQTVTFTIKNPIFKVENLEYVAGYSIVLVYTNEDGVSFKYGNGDDALQLYDVSMFGYKYNNNNYGNGTEQHAHVFAIVFKGAADISKIYASNDEALKMQLPEGYNTATPFFVNDVNNKSAAVVGLDDITAVQSVYNVNAENMPDIQLVLRCDVNRDKKVDVYGDVTQVTAYYLSITQD